MVPCEHNTSKASRKRVRNRSTMEAADRDLAPPVLDLSLPDEKLRTAAQAALTGTLSPVLCLINHGCEAACVTLSAQMQRQAGALPPGTVQQAIETDAAGCEAAATALRGCLRDVGLRVLGLALGDTNIEETLKSRQLDLQGRLCLRAYPAGASPPAAAASTTTTGEPPPRLGAHCDSTLFTMLWADSAGLQVLDPVRAADWRPEAVLRYGLPTMGPVDDVELPTLREDQWCSVAMDWAANPLLLTLGSSWLTNELTSARLPARCAVLHRVVLPANCARHSLPFLADLVTTAQ
jgi:isopenicillin N synthase-like dioxygenase